MKKMACQLSALFLCCFWATVVFCPPASAQTIIEEWDTIPVPPAPELKAVTIDPQVTALLLLDFNKQTCNAERRPRCIASIPGVQKLLALARGKGVYVVYSLSPGAVSADIAKELAPLGPEPVVTSGPDKFFGTELEKLLKERGITTVIVAGTAANGAVLYTASGAAFRGMQVIVPVDGISAETTYAEQYVAWNMLNAPRVSQKAVLTKIALIK